MTEQFERIGPACAGSVARQPIVLAAFPRGAGPVRFIRAGARRVETRGSTEMGHLRDNPPT